MTSRHLGLASGTVLVAPYDPAWPALFAAEVERLEPVLALHGLSLELHHTGSTAVPGLAAKPVLDILAGRRREDDRARAIGALQAAGYSYRGEQEIPGRDFFRRGEPRAYHIHCAAIGSAFWRDHLTFRDHLRAHPAVATAYAALKQELAARFPRDREAYIQGKSAFIAAVLEQARAAHGTSP